MKDGGFDGDKKVGSPEKGIDKSDKTEEVQDYVS